MKQDQDQFCFRRTAFYSQLKSKVGNIVKHPHQDKSTVLCINLDIDDAPIVFENLSSPIHFSLLRYTLPPIHLVCVRLHHSPALVLSLTELLREILKSEPKKVCNRVFIER